MKYYYNKIRNSDIMLEATLEKKNAQKVCELLENAHLVKIKPGDKLKTCYRILTQQWHITLMKK